MLPWHEESARHIEAVLEAGRLPHALLIRSTEGWGDVEFANWLALRLLNIAAPPAADGLSARELAHPDLRWVQPDGAVIKVDEIRAIAEFATGTAQGGGRKVAVIEQAHLMNLNAANALLKTLEEPPAGTHLLLTSSQPGGLLATIVSRCQSLVLAADEPAARDWLIARWGSEAVAERLIEYGCAPLAVDAALTAQEPALLPLLSSLAGSVNPTREVDQLLQLDLDRLMTRWYRSCVALLAGDLQPLWGDDLPAARLTQFVDELTSARRQLLFSNAANARFLLERLAVKWQQLGRAGR